MATPSNKSSSARRKANRPARKRNRPPRISTPAILGIGGLAVVIILAFIFLLDKPSQAVGAIQGVQTYPNLERGHTTDPVTYAQTPPVGGVHDPVWQNCGVYSTPVRNENAVHSLEHGAIWITYQPDLPADEVQKLQALTRQSGYRLLSPYPGLPSPIVASAWGYQLKLEKADDPRLADFIQKYEQNPQGPEPGATCTGGTGQPG